MTKRFKRTEELATLRGQLAATTGLTGHELDTQLKAEKWLPEDHAIARKAFNEAVELIILGDSQPDSGECTTHDVCTVCGEQYAIADGHTCGMVR